MEHIHPCMTYGLKFKIGKTAVSLLTDTKYFSGLSDFYRADILIISVVFFKPWPEIAHLSLPEAEEIIKAVSPKKAILTHFGMTMLEAKPHIQAEELTRRLGIEVIAAYDGMSVNF